MKEFAIIMIFVIVGGLQHLLNWMWRNSDMYSHKAIPTPIAFVATIIALLASYFLIMAAIHWCIMY
jgi:hypothetical protein